MRSLLVILSLTVSLIVNAQINYDHARFERLLKEERCAELVEEALAVRESEYGKNWMTDYYLSLAMCCLGEIERAGRCFDAILEDYSKDPNVYNLITSSRNSCSRPAEIRIDNSFVSEFITATFAEADVSSSVRGKMGYVFNCDQVMSQFQLDPTFDQEELTKRIFDISELDEAEKYYKDYLPKKFGVVGQGRFVFILPSKRDVKRNHFVRPAAELERIYTFFYKYYGVRPSNKVIAVYLMGNKKRLAEAAQIAHGINIPKENIGYSNLSDLSVLGNSTKQGMGTIVHELFHLMIRTDIGDIPAWLDEGLASLYEESHWKNDTLRHNKRVWRTTVLRQHAKRFEWMPSIKHLIAGNWSNFQYHGSNDELLTVDEYQDEVNACDVALNYAMAKHLMMFFDSRDLIPSVIQAYKERPSRIFEGPDFDPVNVLEEAIAMPIEQLQDEFNHWMSREYNVNLNIR